MERPVILTAVQLMILQKKMSREDGSLNFWKGLF